MQKLYNDITKNIKRYSNNYTEDIKRYVENKRELNINTIDFYMSEIKEAIGKKNWFYIYDILEDKLFFEYIHRDYIHKKLMKYIELHGADVFIKNLRANLINSSSTTSYVFILDFLWR